MNFSLVAIVFILVVIDYLKELYPLRGLEMEEFFPTFTFVH